MNKTESTTMNFDDWDRLRPIGLTPPVAQALAALDAAGAPMRITQVHRDSVIVCDGAQESQAHLLPRLRRTPDALTVGDWVAVERDPHRALWVGARMEPLT
ncbi:MAG: hypothetical protein OEU89_09020, partial [Burkholderiaceae bacterium]|nr:hypothetical protein [Burkholderiaceae bacterium]